MRVVHANKYAEFFEEIWILNCVSRGLFVFILAIIKLTRSYNIYNFYPFNDKVMNLSV